MSLKSENQNLTLQFEMIGVDALIGSVHASGDKLVAVWEESSLAVNPYDRELLRLEIVKTHELLVGMVGER